jgi:hypothetical protein
VDKLLVTLSIYATAVAAISGSLLAGVVAASEAGLTLPEPVTGVLVGVTAAAGALAAAQAKLL